MLVKQEQLNPCEVELHIEVDAEQVSAAIDRAYMDIGKSANISGFRKGKAPKAILQQVIDEEKVKDRAADDLLAAAYADALDETKLEPFAIANVDIVKFEIGEPMSFKARVPLAPKTELGKYKGLVVERPVFSVSDEDVDGELLRLRRRHATYPEITDRPAQEGDIVRFEIKTNGTDEQPKSDVAKVGENLPEFDKALVGMNVDEEKVIDIAYPEDYPLEDHRGKTIAKWVKLCEIHEERLPDLTDDWVKDMFLAHQEGAEGDDAVDTVDKLRAKVRSAMEEATRDTINREVENKIVHQVVAGAEVCFPQALVNAEIGSDIDELLENLKKRKLTMEDYLKYRDITAEQLQDEFDERARRELKTRLVLRRIVDDEGLKVDQEDIEAELKSMAVASKVPVETVRAYVEKTDGMSSIKNRILTEKVMDFLVESTNIKDVG